MTRFFSAIFLTAFLAGCQGGGATRGAPSPDPAPAAGSGVPKPSPSASTASNDAAAPTPSPEALPDTELVRLFRELSEPDRYFFSDNYVSNETSYLQVAGDLTARARQGGAYIGVGPEQNFTYLALTEPRLAFILDIRRGNALEHLLYKAIFETATSRAHFVALLIGRRYEESAEPGAASELAQVLKHAERAPADPKVYAELHAQLLKRIRAHGFELSADDEKTLGAMHRALFERGLDTSFELHEKNGRKYPRLRELLSAKDQSGKLGSFLDDEAAFRRVQRLQQQNRVIPVVGDFAGEHALKKIGAELARRDLPVSVFYTSNVEQYLMEPDKWKAWAANIDALPSDERTLFLRCYLDQGRRHPAQMEGHRTASLVSSFDQFKWRNRTRGYGSFFQLVTDTAGPDAGH